MKKLLKRISGRTILNLKKVIKEKNFLENIFSFYNIATKDIQNLKELYKLGLEEK